MFKRRKRRIHPKHSYDPTLSKKIDKKLERNLTIYVFAIIVVACVI